MQTRPSLKDVAKEAGVSVATVSRHLNGSISLPERTRSRIDSAVAQLRYRPNPHARRLSLGRSDTIALVVPDIANPFFSLLAASVERAASDQGSMVVLHATFNSDQRELAALEQARQNHVDGLIFSTNHQPSGAVADALGAMDRAIVLDEAVPGASVPSLFCDNQQGGYLAGRHLAEIGHRHVAYIGGGSELYSTKMRLKGFEQGLASVWDDGDTRVDLFTGEHSVESGRHLTAECLERAPLATALFIGSDELAIGAIETIKKAGISIPELLSIISFDDVRSLHLYDPPITAVSQPVRDLGRAAVDLLMNGDWTGDGLRGRVDFLKVSLTKRASVAAPAIIRASDA